jgi:ribosome-associated heat shock protein Hsp15
VAPPEDRQRLDVWLWCARVAKTRAACAALVESGAVRINRQPTVKPHARVAPGDVLTLALGQGAAARIRVWRVLVLAERRGPASEAAGLYQDLDADGV